MKLLPLLLAFGGAFWAGTEFERNSAKDRDEFLTLQRDDYKAKLSTAEPGIAQSIAYKHDLEECRREASEGRTSSSKNGVKPVPAPSAGEIEAEVFDGDTLNVSHQLYVTIATIVVGKSQPPRYQALMTLGAPGVKSAEFHAFAGDVTTFSGYEIRVTQIDPVSAWLHVRKEGAPER